MKGIKLKAVKIVNFAGIELAEADLSKQVTVFAGLNSVGKTSLRDAIIFGLTGKARGVKNFTEIKRGALTYKGKNAKDTEVTLTIESEGETVELKRNAAQPSKSAAKWPDIVGLCLDPVRYLNLPEKHRAAVLTEVLSTGNDKVIKSAYKEHIGKVPEEIKSRMMSIGVDWLDPDSVRDAVCEVRRQYKRQTSKQNEDEPTLADFNLMQDYTPTGANKQHQKLVDYRDKLVADMLDPRDAVLPLLEQAVNSADEQDSDEVDCPCCGQKMSVSKALELDEKLRKEFQQKKESQSANMLGEINSKIKEVEDKMRRYDEFSTAHEVWKTAQSDAEKTMWLIRECDRIDDALKDGGPVKSYISEHGAGLPINEGIKRAWGLESLTWKANGQISLHGRPVELASESERYRVAGVMGIALAEVTGIKVAAFDGYEVLVGQNASGLVRVAANLNINNILMFISTAKDFSGITYKNVGIYQVKPDGVTLIST